MTSYLVKDKITNLENGEVLTYYHGTDGYVHDDILSPAPYKRKSDAMRRINKELKQPHMRQLDDHQAIEGGKWHHIFSIIEIDQEQERQALKMANLKKGIIERVNNASKSRTIEQSEPVMVFQTMGGGLCDDNYEGDIFNHRIRSEFELNGVKWLIEACAVNERITLHKITRKPLKHIKTLNAQNGLSLAIDCLNAPSLERSCSGVYGLFGSERQVAHEFIANDLIAPAYTFRRIICLVNRELRTQYKRAVLLYTCPSDYMTIDEALASPYIKQFEHEPTTGKQLQYDAQSRNCWEGLKYAGVIPSDEDFKDHACWISSSALHGYYFPNSQSPINCFAFTKWDDLVIVLKGE